jgi:hypothetical protein
MPVVLYLSVYLKQSYTTHVQVFLGGWTSSLEGLDKDEGLMLTC